MAVTEVILSDGKPCKVKRLGPFDLDGVGPAIVGPFTYTYKLANGQEIEDVYDISVLSTPPSHPGIPEDEINEHTPQWYALLEWQTYQAAVVHERKRHDSVAAYVFEVSKFIVDNCVDAFDITRIQTEEDWDAVYKASVIPQVTIEMLAQTFKETFAATFEGKEIFNALSGIIKGAGSYDAMRVWEIDTMAKFGFQTEEEWVNLSLAERTRKIAGLVLPKLMESLESDKSYKEAIAERGKK